MEEIKTQTEPEIVPTFKITFDIVNHRGIFLMPYEGQVLGETFKERFEVIPDVIPGGHFDWTKYYAIYHHDDVALFTNKGMKVPGTYYEYPYPIVKIGQKIAIYAISKMPNPNGSEFIDIIANAWYVPHPFELKEMDIVVYEDPWSSFEHYYVNPQ